jgi:hypothetical protein
MPPAEAYTSRRRASTVAARLRAHVGSGQRAVIARAKPRPRQPHVTCGGAPGVGSKSGSNTSVLDEFAGALRGSRR